MPVDYNGAGLGVKRYSPPDRLTLQQACEGRAFGVETLQLLISKKILPAMTDAQGRATISSDYMRHVSSNRALTAMREHKNPKPQYPALNRAQWLSAADHAIGLAHPRDPSRRIDPEVLEELMASGQIASRVCEATGDRLATKQALRDFCGLHREGLQIIRAKQLQADDQATLSRIAGERKKMSREEAIEDAKRIESERFKTQYEKHNKPRS